MSIRLVDIYLEYLRIFQSRSDVLASVLGGSWRDFAEFAQRVETNLRAAPDESAAARWMATFLRYTGKTPARNLIWDLWSKSFDELIPNLIEDIEIFDEMHRAKKMVSDLLTEREVPTRGISLPAELDWSVGFPGEVREAAQAEAEPADGRRPARYADYEFLYTAPPLKSRAVPHGNALLAGHDYILEVSVRVHPTGIPVKGSERRPVSEPGSETPVTVLVTAEVEDNSLVRIEESVRKLTLPPLGDSSENARFLVQTQRPSARQDDLARIRIRLFYGFNLLEVATVSAEILPRLADETRPRWGLEQPIWAEQERLERAYNDFGNLLPRQMNIHITAREQGYQFTFTFPNLANQGPEVSVFSAPVRLARTDLEDDLLAVRKIWLSIAHSQTLLRQLEGDPDEFIDQVRRLAKAGRDLWVKLFKRERNSSIYLIGQWLEEHPLPQDGLIQISIDREAHSFVFPWALLYDRPIPLEKWALPDLEGFWGLRYCIEQQLQLDDLMAGSDAPIQVQDPMKLAFMLWKEFPNADQMQALIDDLQLNAGGKLVVSGPITRASDCVALLRQCDAQILYFYSHGYTRQRREDVGVGLDLQTFTQFIESLPDGDQRRTIFQPLYERIQKKEYETGDSWIELSSGVLYLRDLYDTVEKISQSPLVILNMCESAQVTPSLADSFIHFFLDRSARAVLGTECPMTIYFAEPFAARLLPDILRGAQVGQAVLDARRFYMDSKNPLGLAYTLYGQATVSFQPPRF
jgi:hypothetical protein